MIKTQNKTPIFTSAGVSSGQHLSALFVAAGDVEQSFYSHAVVEAHGDDARSYQPVVVVAVVGCGVLGTAGDSTDCSRQIPLPSNDGFAGSSSPQCVSPSDAGGARADGFSLEGFGRFPAKRGVLVPSLQEQYAGPRFHSHSEPTVSSAVIIVLFSASSLA